MLSLLRSADRLLQRLGRRPLFGLLALVSLFVVGMDRPVAPLKDPIFCGYLRLQESFSLVAAQDSSPTGKHAAFLREIMGAWKGWRGSLRSEKGRSNKPGELASLTARVAGTDPIPFLKDLARRREFAAEDLYVYYKNPDEFAILLTGSIVPGRWRDLFPDQLVLHRDLGFAVLFNSPGKTGQLVLHFRNGLAFLAPAELEGNLVDALREGVSGLNDRFKTFRAMVQRQPLLAIETDLQALAGQLAKSGNPNLAIREPLSAVAMFRLIVDSQFVKAQFHVPSDPGREEVADLVETLAGSIRGALTGGVTTTEPSLKAGQEALGRLAASLRTGTKGQSVFIEGTGLQDEHPLAGLTALGLISSIGESSFERFAAQFPPATDRASVPPGAAPITAAQAVAGQR